MGGMDRVKIDLRKRGTGSARWGTWGNHGLKKRAIPSNLLGAERNPTGVERSKRTPGRVPQWSSTWQSVYLIH